MHTSQTTSRLHQPLGQPIRAANWNSYITHLAARKASRIRSWARISDKTNSPHSSNQPQLPAELSAQAPPKQRPAQPHPNIIQRLHQEKRRQKRATQGCCAECPEAQNTELLVVQIELMPCSRRKREQRIESPAERSAHRPPKTASSTAQAACRSPRLLTSLLADCRLS